MSNGNEFDDDLMEQIADEDEADGTQSSLFDKGASWEKEWQDMPEYVSRDMTPFRSLNVHFESQKDVDEFCKLVGQKTTEKTKFIWYPEMTIGRFVNKRYVQDDGQGKVNPRYPVYVISKGRWKNPQTSRALDRLGVPHRVVIEPQEFDAYAASRIGPERLLVLPFSDLGQGSIPARNWVWEHSIEEGHARHWILDDNLKDFFRMNYNRLIPVRTGAMFRAAERFVDRYENIVISGFHYFMFASRKCKLPPFYRNTRVYSCILIDNSLDLRWRGRYNEDTDLSIRALKQGYCTMLFLAFLADKTTTMTMKGGNTEDLYEIEDGRLKMAESLCEQHPDIARISWKWGRWQHHVDYSQFRRNKLILRPGVDVPDGVNDLGMKLTIDGRIEPTWSLDHVE